MDGYLAPFTVAVVTMWDQIKANEAVNKRAQQQKGKMMKLEKV